MFSLISILFQPWDSLPPAHTYREVVPGLKGPMFEHLVTVNLGVNSREHPKDVACQEALQRQSYDALL